VAISATLAINETVQRRRRAGHPVLPLGFGEAGLPVHPELRSALAAAAGAGGYGPVAGIEPLRLAAAGYWERRGLPTDPELVVTGPGTKPLLYALLRSLDGPVALPRPSWVSYAAQATLLHQGHELVPARLGHGGVPDPDRLAAAASAATRAGAPLRSVVLTLPDNPTGTLADPELVRGVCRVAREHDLVIISDEIYRDLVHDPAARFASPAEFAPERTVVTTGLSKSLALGGWRTGVVRLPSGPMGEALRGRLTEVASEIWSSAPHPVQEACAWAFTEPPVLTRHVAASRALHGCIARAVAERFTAVGASVPHPQAAFYLYPDLEPHRERLAARWGIHDGAQLARALLDDHGIATLPGAAFGDLERSLRLRVATSLLYGELDEQRDTTLAHPEPAALPWIADALSHLTEALEALVGP
jgi:aspartate aminotransferase